LKPDHSAYDTTSWQYKLTKKDESRICDPGNGENRFHEFRLSIRTQ
jgi:hypothetical protein